MCLVPSDFNRPQSGLGDSLALAEKICRMLRREYAKFILYSSHLHRMHLLCLYIFDFPQKCKMIVNSKEELPVATPLVPDEESGWKPFSGSAPREQKPISFNINVTATHGLLHISVEHKKTQHTNDAFNLVQSYLRSFNTS